MISGIKKALQKPYPYHAPLRTRVLTAIGISLFVFLFLWVFQPFGLVFQDDIFQLALGYGGVCFTVLVFLTVVFYPVRDYFFSEENWTTAHEIFWQMTVVSTVAFANFLFSCWYFAEPLTLNMAGQFLLFTFGIAVFPLAAIAIIHQQQLSVRYRAETALLHQQVEQQQHQQTTPVDTLLILHSENTGDPSITIPADNLLFIRSADNYVEVFFLENGKTEKRILRNSLKNIADNLPASADLLRCHKSYLVNLRQVTDISGNAQGFKLHLNHLDILVPVSRNLNNTIKNYFTVHP